MLKKLKRKLKGKKIKKPRLQPKTKTKKIGRVRAGKIKKFFKKEAKTKAVTKETMRRVEAVGKGLKTFLD